MALNFPVEHIVNFLTKDSIFHECAVGSTFVRPDMSISDVYFQGVEEDSSYMKIGKSPTYPEAQMQIENVIKRFIVLCPQEVTGLLHGCLKFCDMATQSEGYQDAEVYAKQSNESRPWIKDTSPQYEFQAELLRLLLDTLPAIGVQQDEIDFLEQPAPIIDYIDSNVETIFTRSKITPRGFYDIFCKEHGVIQHFMSFIGAYLRVAKHEEEALDVPSDISRHFPFNYEFMIFDNTFPTDDERKMISLNDAGFLTELQGTGADRDQIVVLLAYAGVYKAKVFPFVVDWMWKRVERDHGTDHKQAFNIAAMFSTHVVKTKMAPLLESGFVKGDDVIPEETYQSLCAYFKEGIGEPFMTEDPEAAEKERKEWVDTGLYIEGKLSAEQVRQELVHSESKSSLAPKSETESQLWLFGGVAALAGFLFLRR